MMTEDQAHANAEALSLAMGITFYVVRRREGDFSAVQTPADEQEIVATIEPPSEHLIPIAIHECEKSRHHRPLPSPQDQRRIRVQNEHIKNVQLTLL